MTIASAFLLGLVAGAIGMAVLIVWLLSWVGAVIEAEFDWRETT